MAEAIDELRKYHKGWADAMGVFWRERMEKLRTIDTGRRSAQPSSHVSTTTWMTS